MEASSSAEGPPITLPSTLITPPQGSVQNTSSPTSTVFGSLPIWGANTGGAGNPGFYPSMFLPLPLTLQPFALIPVTSGGFGLTPAPPLPLITQDSLVLGYYSCNRNPHRCKTEQGTLQVATPHSGHPWQGPRPAHKGTETGWLSPGKSRQTDISKLP